MSRKNAKNGNRGPTPHERKLAAFLDELKSQYAANGAFDPKQAARDIGHPTIAGILWADPWLQAHLGGWLEKRRQIERQDKRRRVVAAGESSQRERIVEFCLEVAADGTEGTADRLRAAALAAELLGLKKHLPAPTSPEDAKGAEMSANWEELLEEYPELAGGTLPEGHNGSGNGAPSAD